MVPSLSQTAYHSMRLGKSNMLNNTEPKLRAFDRRTYISEVG